MFKKFLNVGKGYASDKLQHQQQQDKQQQNQLTSSQQQQQHNHHHNHHHQQQQNLQQQFKNQFQLNEIKSYGFSNLCCLGYSASLSLIAVGSKYGLLRVLGQPSVEFSYQLESGNSIRQIEFIDCRPAPPETTSSHNNKRVPVLQAADNNGATSETTSAIKKPVVAAKIVALTDNSQLHVFHLNTFKGQNYADNTTQTDGLCCQSTAASKASDAAQQQQQQPQKRGLEFTKLELVSQLNFFKFKPEDVDDRSRRITTIEVSSDGSTVYVGTEGGNLYQVPLDKFDDINSQQQQLAQQESSPKDGPLATSNEALSNNKKASSSNQETPVTDAVAAGAATENGNGEKVNDDEKVADEETTAVNLNDEPQIEDSPAEPFEPIKFDEHVMPQLRDSVKAKKQGAVESIKRHPTSSAKLLISYHRGLSIIYDVRSRSLETFFYHNQVLESSCFVDQLGDLFYTSHNDGSYIKWDTRKGNQTKASDDFIGQLYGPYPCKPTPKLQACAGLVNDQLEDLLIFSGGMPRATYDDKNPVTIVRTESDGKDTIKTVLDFTSKVLDFAVITRPRGQLGAGAKSTGGGGSGGGGKKNKHRQQQQQQQRNTPIAVALAILAEEEFVVIDLLNSESFLEFSLPYLNCVHSSSITCNQHYSDISDELYQQLVAYNKQQLEGKLSANEWPITGGKVIEAPETKSHDILLTGHEDGSVQFWDVSSLTMRHLLHLSTARYFSTNEDDLNTSDDKITETAANQDDTTQQTEAENGKEADQDSSSWPPLKRVGRFDPYSDDTRLAVRRLSLCPQKGTLVVAGTGGQVLVFELAKGSSEGASSSAPALPTPTPDEITLVSDQRFAWKGRGKLQVRQQQLTSAATGYQLASHVQLNPPVAATSLDLRSDWSLYALGTSYGFILYDYATSHCVVSKCTLNVQDFAIVGGGAPGVGTISRKKSFRKSLRESFRRLRRGRSQRNNPLASSLANPTSTATPASAPPNNSTSPGTGIKPAFGRATTGVRTLNAPSSAPAPTTGAVDAAVHRNVYSTERQVEPKVELSSIVRCVTLTSAVITNNSSFSPSLWVGTNAGHVLLYAITLATTNEQATAAAGADATKQVTGAADAQRDVGAESQAAGSSANLQQQPVNEEPRVTVRPMKSIQLKHKAPIIAIFTSPEAPRPIIEQRAASIQNSSTRSSPEKSLELLNGNQQQQDKQAAGAAGDSANSVPASLLKSSQQIISSSGKQGGLSQQPRVLICSEEQFKVLNLPNLKRFCKYKLTAHEGLRAKTISITQFLKPASKQQLASLNANSKSLQSFATQTSPPASPVPPADVSGAAGAAAADLKHESNNNSESTFNHNNHKSSEPSSNSKELMNAKFGAKSSSSSATPSSSNQQQQQSEEAHELAEPTCFFEPYMVCMSNQGDCAVYSVPDLKRQAQVQVCKREDVNGITSTMLTNYGEGYYLKSSSTFLRFSISTHRVPKALPVL